MQRYNDAIEKGAAPLIPDILNLVFEYSGTILKTGSLIDCLDPYGLWFEAQVVEVHFSHNQKAPISILVHYVDWITSDIALLNANDVRIAPLHTHSIINEKKNIKRWQNYTKLEQSERIDRFVKMGYNASLIESEYEEVGGAVIPHDILHRLNQIQTFIYKRE